MKQQMRGDFSGAEGDRFNCMVLLSCSAVLSCRSGCCISPIIIINYVAIVNSFFEKKGLFLFLCGKIPKIV